MQGEALAFLQTYLLNPEETFVLQETIRSPMDMRLIINNRNGVKYGNLSVRWDNRDYEYHLGSLEVYYWYNRLGKIVYQLEWGVEIPELVDEVCDDVLLWVSKLFEGFDAVLNVSRYS